MKKYEGVLKKVYEYESKRGITYAKPDGALYKTLHVLYVMIFIWSFIMNSFTALSFMMRYSTIGNKGTIRNIIFTLIVGSLSMLAGCILSRLKCYISASITTIIPIAVLLPLYMLSFRNNLDGLWGYSYPFYWRYLLPLSFIAILMVWMTVIALRARHKTNKQYKQIVERLFEENFANDEDSVSEEEWDEFLKNYNTDEK